ncbi:hypothetical protein [Yoonia sp. 2307UL14-13]|uniref:hypothetical protein n=1 Tax=Yoonia sp. 2307UL14-13 TaxID=3126506 RepID=UPI00309F1172
MSRNPLEYGSLLILALLGGGLVFGLSQADKADFARYQARISAYVADVQAGVAQVGEEVPTVEVAAVSDGQPTALAAALAIETVRPPIVTFAADPAAGWSRADTEDGDYEKMARVAPIDWAVENPAIAELNRDMATHIGEQARVRSRDRNVEHAALTYRNGDRMILMSIRFLPAATFEGVPGAEFGLLQEMMRGLCETEYGATDKMQVQGMTFAVSAIEGTTDAQRFVGFIGPQVDIELWTNADKSDVRAVLEQTDIAGLRALVDPAI